MASIPSHAVFAGALGEFFRDRKQKVAFIWWGMLCGSLPDFDVIGMWAGVAYGSLFGHRGFTHSIFFAVVVSLIVTVIVSRKAGPLSAKHFRLWCYFFLATLSHPVLDAMTTGGLGVAFFSPFSNHRYFFPFRPIAVSHIGVAEFFRHGGISVLKNEFFWIWIPTGVIVLCGRVIKFLRRAKHDQVMPS